MNKLVAENIKTNTEFISCFEAGYSVMIFTEVFSFTQDWSDYDEEAGVSVGIYEVTHQFLRL